MQYSLIIKLYILYLYMSNAKNIKMETFKTEKTELIEKVMILTATKKKLYSNMNIETPMNNDEKNLNKEIANIYSRINQIIRENRTRA